LIAKRLSQVASLTEVTRQQSPDDCMQGPTRRDGKEIGWHQWRFG